jgi:hypothetical protein
MSNPSSNPHNPLKASWLNPHGDSMAVDFIYGRFGVALIESTPYIAVRVLPCTPKTVISFCNEQVKKTLLQ